VTKERFYLVSVDVMVYAKDKTQARSRVKKQLSAPDSRVEEYEDWPKFTDVRPMTWNEHHFMWVPGETGNEDID